MKKELRSVTGGVFSALSGLGMTDIGVSMRLMKDWDELAGDPWAGQTRPLGIREGELIIETAVPTLVSLLRYATGALHERLEAVVGTGVISSITVQAPPRYSSR